MQIGTERRRAILGRLAQGIMRVPKMPGGLRLARGILGTLPEGVAILMDRWGVDYFVHYESHVGSALLTERESEPSIVELAETELSTVEGPNILDIGANAGTFSLPLCRGAKKVGLVEANPQLTELLRKTVSYNGFENVEVLNGAVTDEDKGRVNFYEAKKLKNLSSLRKEYVEGRDEYSKAKIQTIKLEEVMEELGMDQVDLLKIDIEGMSTEGILSLGKRAKDVDVIIAESDDRIESAKRFLEKSGFICSRPFSGMKKLPGHTQKTLMWRQ